MAIIALVGMTGSGKTEAANVFVKAGFERVYFGQIVLDVLQKQGMPLAEEFEKPVREELRERHGMAAMAILGIPKIENSLAKGKNALIDGLYSWEELLVLRKRFPDLIVVAICASPAVRYARLSRRKIRPLSLEEARERDVSEIEKLHKGGPIAVADFTIVNEGTVKALEKEVKGLIKRTVGKKK